MIVGYEFLLDWGPGKPQEWTQLHGSGGAVGNGALHVQESTAAEQIAAKLLKRVRRELKRDGIVRRSNDAQHDEPLTIEPITPRAVLQARPMIVFHTEAERAAFADGR